MVDVRRVTGKDILFYTGTRYFEFVLKFFYGLLIAKILGPELFGVWGFLMLVQQYLLWSGLGFQYVITVELSNKSAGVVADQEKLIANALGATLAVATIVSLIGLTLQLGPIEPFPRYQFHQYAFVTALMVGAMNLVNVLLCAYRVFGDVQKISIVQLMRVAVPMLTLFIFEGETLIFMLIAAMLLANLFGIAFFLHRSPFQIRFSFHPGLVNKLLLLGLPLLVFNVAFNLILVSARTVLSIFYPVEIMGHYSFAGSITNATLLGFKSVVFVLMPNLIHQTRADVDNVQAAAVVTRVNQMYSTAVFLAAWGIILFQPLLFVLLPAYRQAGMAVSVLMLAQAVLAATFGYNTLALSRGKQLNVAKISLTAVLVVTTVSVGVAVIGLTYNWIAVAVLIGAYVFAVLQTRLGARLVEQPLSGPACWTGALTPGNSAAILLFLIFSLLGHRQVAAFTGAAVFFITNQRTLKQLLYLGVLRRGDL